MDLKPQYKQTEAGIIPEDWNAKPIGGEIDLLTGYPFPSSGYVASGVRLLRGSNVKRGHTDWNDDITQHWPAVTLDVARYQLRRGDLVIAMDGSLVGRSFAQLKPEDLPALLVQRVARVRSEKLDITYLAAFIASERFVKYADSVKTVTAIPHISPDDIRNFTIPIPPTVEEQRAVASALSDADALLNGLDRLIAKKRDFKQMAMQQLLTGRTRLPGFNGAWEAGNLSGVIAALEAGVSVNSVEDSDADFFDGVFVLKTSAVAGGRFMPSECKRVAVKDVSRACLNPLKGTILISRMNTPDLVGECGYVDRDYPNLFVPDRLWMTRLMQDCDVSARWLSYLLSSAMLKRQIRAAATGTSGSMKNLSKQAFLKLPIALPSGREQSAIAAVLADIDAELFALEARRDKTRALKQAMMQELLTGKTRLIPIGGEGA